MGLGGLGLGSRLRARARLHVWDGVSARVVAASGLLLPAPPYVLWTTYYGLLTMDYSTYQSMDC